VALVGAAVNLVEAEVTWVAAVETDRAEEVFDGELVEAVRVVLTAVDRLLALVFGRRAARLGVLPLVDLARAGRAEARSRPRAQARSAHSGRRWTTCSWRAGWWRHVRHCVEPSRRACHSPPDRLNRSRA